MFEHADFRPLWLRLRPRKGHILWAIAWGFAYLAAARGILAAPPPGAPPACAAASQQEAKSLADRLYDKGDYQRAGECYEVAGDMPRADRAFVKAAGPKSEEAARDLKAQANAAQALFSRVGQAFRSSH